MPDTFNSESLLCAREIGSGTSPRAEKAGHHRIGCLAGETMILTTNGVQPIGEMAGKTHELLTSGGVWAKALVENCGPQRLLKVTLTRNKVLKELYGASDHRWLLRTTTATGNRLPRQRPECSTSELLFGDRLAFAYRKRDADLSVKADGVARGFVFGDGSATPHSSIANFCGTKDREILRFFAGWREPRAYGSVLRVTGLPRSWKKEYPDLRRTLACI